MPRHILVKRGTFGLIYQVIGGVENGRTLTIEAYCDLLDAGVPVVREPLARNRYPFASRVA